MKHFGWLLTAGLLACLPTLHADQVTITLTGVNGAYDTNTNVYVGAYYGQIGGMPITLYCDDFVSHAHIGQPFQANVSTFADLSQTLYGSVADALNKYRRVAWLIDHFAQTNVSEWGDIHFALWSIFNPDAVGPLSSGAQNWFTLSGQASGDSSLDGKYIIYTPVNRGESQEFFSPTPTPEPGSVLLLATALVGTFLICRRMRGQGKAAVKPQSIV